METGKTGKYFKYAIGEIILVVIGILIALQINNWNDKKRENKQSKEFNLRLLAEVNANINVANKSIKRTQLKINSSQSILKLFNEDINKSTKGKLDSLIYIVIGGTDVRFITGTLNEGLNTGKVALISSDILKSKLYSLPSNIEYVYDYSDVMTNYIDERLQTFLYKNYNYRIMDNTFSEYNMGTSKFRNQHAKSLLNSEEFENLIDNYFFQSNTQKQRYTDLKKEYESIGKLIEKELQTTQ
jgi:hypothetical protein